MKKEKDKENIKSSGQNLPGYPHYPDAEDEMGPNGEQRVDVDIDDLSGKPLTAGLKQNIPAPLEKDPSPEIVPGNEADLTPDDLQALGPKDRNNDGGDDQVLLPELDSGPDLTGDDLDTPGAELDDDMEETGSEDEENNYYSRGQE